MTHEKWFISDTHFFHGNILKFVDDEGLRIRREFNSLDQMHETIVKNWNSVVGHNDYVYHLGDVTFQYHRPFNELMYSLKGKKRLIVGNHDKLKQEGLFKHFEKVELVGKSLHQHGVVLFHYPYNPFGENNDKFRWVLHGHIHRNVIDKPRTKNLSVEVINYTPVNLDTILKDIKTSEQEEDLYDLG